MNWLLTVGIVVLLAAAILAFFFLKPTTRPTTLAGEERLYDIIDEELEQAIENMTAGDIESALLG